MQETVPSRCHVCLELCPIAVHKTDGRVTKVSPLPGSKNDGICAKGQSGVFMLYDPDRVDTPLRRTNPKGLGADPGWEPISWEDALDTITDELSARIADDPRRIFIYHGLPLIWHSKDPMAALGGALGTPNLFRPGGTHCGNGMHFYNTTHGTFITQPDYEEADYVMLVGCNLGNAVADMGPYPMQLMADAKERGTKVVDVDPVGGPGASVADEWVPIRPGTDGAFLLGLMNVLVEELGTYDREYLAAETNAPYLIGPDGHYVRGEADKPLVWDTESEAAVAWDAPPSSIALEGRFVVDGEPVRPAFAYLREAIQAWPVDRAAEVSTVPAERIRAIGAELGNRARIGDTVEREGETLRYRPVSVVAYKGLNAHDNANGAWQAVFLLNQLLGTIGAVGGLFAGGGVSKGYNGNFAWEDGAGADGIYEIPGWRMMDRIMPTIGFPVAEPERPRSYTLDDLNSVPVGRRVEVETLSDPERYGLDPSVAERPALLCFGGDPLHSTSEPEKVFEGFADGFVAATNLYLDDSVNALADIVLPAASYLERYSVPFEKHEMEWMCRRDGKPTWSHTIQQPVVEPLHERKSDADIMFLIAERVGVTSRFNEILNHKLFPHDEEHRLDPDETYTWRESLDRWSQSKFGVSLDWFEEHGTLEWDIDVDEYYWTQFTPGRTHVYWEHWVSWRERLETLAADGDYDVPRLDDFRPVPYWKPCHRMRAADDVYDLAAVYFKHPIEIGAHTYQNAILHDIHERAPMTGAAFLNPRTAEERGIGDGALVRIESAYGGEIEITARHSQFVHPEVVAMSGGKAIRPDNRHMPFASGAEGDKQYTHLLSHDWEGIDGALFAEDADAPVRVAAVGGGD